MATKRTATKKPRTRAVKGKQVKSTMTLPASKIKNVIRKVITSQNYRDEVIPFIDKEFLQKAAEFLIKVFLAKIEIGLLTEKWYEKEFLNPNLKKEEIAANAGLGMKTIRNANGSSKKVVVINASITHFESLKELLSELSQNTELNVTLTLKYKGVSAELTSEESLIVINALAARKATIRGGAWSTVGKQVEKPLMTALCKIFKVPVQHYDQKNLPDSIREVDFYLIDTEYHKCEVKLMGIGNPESADGALARKVRVFIADKLSDKNKKELDEKEILWIELSAKNGYKKFETVLEQLEIKYTPFDRDLETAVTEALASIPDEEIPTEVVINEAALIEAVEADETI